MSGYPLSPNMNGMGVGVGMPGQAPPHHPHVRTRSLKCIPQNNLTANMLQNMGEGGPGSVPSPSLHQLGPPNAMTDGGMPPGYFPVCFPFPVIRTMHVFRGSLSFTRSAF